MKKFRDKYDLLVDAYKDAKNRLYASINDESSILDLLAYGEEIMVDEPEIALWLFGKALELDSTNVTALVYSALCYWSSGDDIGFKKLRDRALGIAPNDPKVQGLIGMR